MCASTSEANAKFYGSINERECIEGQDQSTVAPSRNGNVNAETTLSTSGNDSQSKSEDNSIVLVPTLMDGNEDADTDTDTNTDGNGDGVAVAIGIGKREREQDRQVVVENGSGSRIVALDSFDLRTLSNMKSSKPPPLPPKPKNLITNSTKTGYFVSSKSLPKSIRTIPISSTESSRKNIF